LCALSLCAMDEAVLVIERLAAGGSGVGRVDGSVCFVPFTAPGDCLKVRITSRKRSWMQGELLELLEPSPWRTEPLCPAFGRCGGCDWQHIRYNDQCRAKQGLLADALQRIAKIASPPVEQTVAAPDPYGYRARAQFKLFSTDTGLLAGFFRRGSRFVIDLPQGCPVVTPGVNAAMLRLRQLLATLPYREQVPQLTIEEGVNGVVAIIHYIGQKQQAFMQLLSEREQELGLTGLFVQSGRKETVSRVFGDADLVYTVPSGDDPPKEISLAYGIGGFSQINRSQNRAMVNLLRQLFPLEPSWHLLDLYCGNGNLSLPLATQVATLLGIEEYAPSVRSAIDNAGQLRVNNSTFKCCNASDELQRLVAAGKRFDAVLLDPPRSGAADLVSDLAALGGGHLVYVSCDPATFARDAALLKGRSYHLLRAVPLDMFPQTAHLETVALFVKQ